MPVLICTPCLLCREPCLLTPARSQLSTIDISIKGVPYCVQGKLCKPATFVSLVIAASLTAIMYKRYLATGKFMPAGLVALLSSVMTVFYVWNLFAMKPPSTFRST